MSLKTENINNQIFQGIKTTISRFRLKPFHYFTEADIHASLLKDLMAGKILTKRPQKHISVSLVHQEYPRNFRFSKSFLKKTKLKNGLRAGSI